LSTTTSEATAAGFAAPASSAPAAAARPAFTAGAAPTLPGLPPWLSAAAAAATAAARLGVACLAFLTAPWCFCILVQHSLEHVVFFVHLLHVRNLLGGAAFPIKLFNLSRAELIGYVNSKRPSFVKRPRWHDDFPAVTNLEHLSMLHRCPGAPVHSLHGGAVL